MRRAISAWAVAAALCIAGCNGAAPGPTNNVAEPHAAETQLRGETSNAYIVLTAYQAANDPRRHAIATEMLRDAFVEEGPQGRRPATLADLDLRRCHLRTVTGTQTEAVAEGGCEGCPGGGPPLEAYFRLTDRRIISIRRQMYEC